MRWELTNRGRLTLRLCKGRSQSFEVLPRLDRYKEAEVPRYRVEGSPPSHLAKNVRQQWDTAGSMRNGDFGDFEAGGGSG